jgi:putative transposase
MTLPARRQPNQNINQFSKPVKNSVSVIINQYKSSVKRWCNKNGFDHFQWQSRFYDQILYDENSIDNIKIYINNNPKNWKEDDLFN